jgi:dihydroorotase-like cyclic amidohydrolase
VGADADLTIIHPTREQIVDSTRMASKSGWSPYESWSLAGFSRTTIVRGEVVVDNYDIVSGNSEGRLVLRESAGLFTRLVSGSGA